METRVADTEVVRAEGFSFSAHADMAQRTRQFHHMRGQPCAEWARWLVPLDDQVVLNKDGSLLACFDMVGLDIDSSTASDFNEARTQLVYALEQLQEEGVTLWWQVRRQKTTRYPTTEFPEPVSQLVDDLMHAAFLKDVHYVNRTSIALIQAPPGGGIRMMHNLRRAQESALSTMDGVWGMFRALVNGLRGAVTGDTDFPFQNSAEIEEANQSFHKMVDQFAASLGKLNVRPLRGNALGGFLELASSPTSSLESSESLPSQDVFLDSTVPRSEIDNDYRDYLKFAWNDRVKWAKTYTLDLSKRESVSLDMLDALMAAPFEFTLSHVFQLLPRAKAERAVEGLNRYHTNRRYPVRSYLAAALKGGDMSDAPINEARQEAANEAQSLMSRLSMGQEGAGYYYGTVMVLGDTPAETDTASSRCEQILQSARLRPVHERLHKFSSFASTVPGSQGEVALWDKITTVNFVDLCPVRTLFKGEEVNDYLTSQLGVECPALLTLPTSYRIPYYFTGYVGDLGHAAMVGPSGSGKTTFVNLCWTEFRKYAGARVFAFDRDYSTRPSILLQGGNYIDFSPQAKALGKGAISRRMNPLRALLGGEDAGMHLQYCVKWVELLARQRGYVPTPRDSVDIEAKLRATMEIGAKSPDQLRLGSLVVQLDQTQPLAQALVPWTQGHVYGKYFDNQEDGFNLSTLTGIEMGGILEDEDLAVPFMSYAFYRIKSVLREMKEKQGTAAPTFIYVPEARYFLKNEMFKSELEDWLATVRKLNGVVWLDTQSPDSLVQSSIYSGLRDNIATTIFTPNRKAKSGSLSNLYTTEFMLTDEELTAIANGMSKRDYFIKQSGISRKVSLLLDAHLMACLRSDKKAQALLDRLYDEEDPEWIATYLQELSHD